MVATRRARGGGGGAGKKADTSAKQKRTKSVTSMAEGKQRKMTTKSEVQLAEYEHELIEMNSNSEKLRHTYNELLVFKMVLLKASDFLVYGKTSTAPEETELRENMYSNNKYVETASLLEQEMSETQSQSGVRFISGIISKSKALRFERMLFRATRGNIMFNQAPGHECIEDPISSEKIEKVVFVVFFSGEQARMKVLKICEAFGANCYPVPEETIKQRQLTRENRKVLNPNSSWTFKVDIHNEKLY